MYGLSEFPQPRHLIRIDIDAEQLERNAHAHLALRADAAPALEAILALDLGPARMQAGAARAQEARTRAIAELTPAMRRQLEFLDAIRDTLPQAILAGDSTQPVYAGNLGFSAATPGSWFNSATGYGTLGYALPAATGAGLAMAASSFHWVSWLCRETSTPGWRS
jgi:acetolactate synthase-1/2/3 large subunit